MYNPTQSVTRLNRTAYESAVELAAFTLGHTERIADFNLKCARAVLEQSVEATRSIAAITDAQQLVAAPVRLTEASVRQGVEYSRAAYDLAAEARAALSVQAEKALAKYATTLNTLLEDGAKQAPAGSQSATAALQSSVAATAAAWGQFAKAAKQVAAATDAALRAASADAAKFASTAAQVA